MLDLSCTFHITKFSRYCFLPRRFPLLSWRLVQTLIKTSLYCAAIIQEYSSYPCHLLTLLLAYLQLISYEKRSFINAQENKHFKEQFPLELQRQWSSKKPFSKNQKIKIIILIINLCALCQLTQISVIIQFRYNFRYSHNHHVRDWYIGKRCVQNLNTCL